MKKNLDQNENFEYERIRSETISSSRYDNSDRNWEEEPIGNSHLIWPSSSLPLIILQPKRDRINLKLNPANINEILMKIMVPVH